MGVVLPSRLHSPIVPLTLRPPATRTDGVRERDPKRQNRYRATLPLPPPVNSTITSGRITRDVPLNHIINRQWFFLRSHEEILSGADAGKGVYLRLHLWAKLVPKHRCIVKPIRPL